MTSNSYASTINPLFAMGFDFLPRDDLLERIAQPNPNNNSASYALFCALS
jgi:hypothetical protein